MGGQGKGERYHDLEKMKSRVKTLLTFGASGASIASDAPIDMETHNFERMEDAVTKAFQLAREHRSDIVFSPGCASFDQFRNFEHRGRTFNQLVAEQMKDHELSSIV
jgi:UDP-N-acetylmuramoylalanine--D-glutamate ligase